MAVSRELARDLMAAQAKLARVAELVGKWHDDIESGALTDPQLCMYQLEAALSEG